jgi:hypothetical protein
MTLTNSVNKKLNTNIINKYKVPAKQAMFNILAWYGRLPSSINISIRDCKHAIINI